MIKKNGKEYPVSLLKVYLPDETLDKLTWIREFLKSGTDNVALTLTIEHVFRTLKDQVDFLEKGEIKEIVNEGKTNA